MSLAPGTMWLSGGGFVNPNGSPVASRGLIPTITPQHLSVFPQQTPLSAVLATLNAGRNALAANAQASASAPSTPTNNNYAAIGSEGATGLTADQLNDSTVFPTVVFGPQGLSVLPQNVTQAVGGMPVSPLSAWQLANPTLDLLGRIGLPIAAFLAWRTGHDVGALALAAPAAVLWYNRLAPSTPGTALPKG